VGQKQISGSCGAYYPSATANIDPDDLAAMYGVLKQQQEGLAHISAVVT